MGLCAAYSGVEQSIVLRFLVLVLPGKHWFAMRLLAFDADGNRCRGRQICVGVLCIQTLQQGGLPRFHGPVCRCKGSMQHSLSAKVTIIELRTC